MLYLVAFLLTLIAKLECGIENKLTKHILEIKHDQRIWINNCLLVEDNLGIQPFKLDSNKKIVFKESCKCCNCIKIIQYNNEEKSIFFVHPKQSTVYSVGYPVPPIRILRVSKSA